MYIEDECINCGCLIYEYSEGWAISDDEEPFYCPQNSNGGYHYPDIGGMNGQSIMVS